MWRFREDTSSFGGTPSNLPHVSWCREGSTQEVVELERVAGYVAPLEFRYIVICVREREINFSENVTCSQQLYHLLSYSCPY